MSQWRRAWAIRDRIIVARGNADQGRLLYFLRPSAPASPQARRRTLCCTMRGLYVPWGVREKMAAERNSVRLTGSTEAQSPHQPKCAQVMRSMGTPRQNHRTLAGGMGWVEYSRYGLPDAELTPPRTVACLKAASSATPVGGEQGSTTAGRGVESGRRTERE